MNKVILDGRLGQKPTLKTSATGNTYVQVGLAKNRKTKAGEKITDWFNMSAFGETAKKMAEWLDAGDTLLVECELRPTKIDAGNEKQRSSYDLIVDRFERIGPSKSSEKSASSNEDYVPF